MPHQSNSGKHEAPCVTRVGGRGKNSPGISFSQEQISSLHSITEEFGGNAFPVSRQELKEWLNLEGKFDYHTFKNHFYVGRSVGKIEKPEPYDKLGDGADKLFDKIGDTFKDLLTKPIFNLTGSCLHWDFRIFFKVVGLRLT
ncbi:hypothetical protein ES703_124460 [subsurface metagenome]